MKLNNRKIRWIIRKYKEGFSVKKLSITQRVSSSRIRQIVAYYKKAGTIPVLKKPGRPKKEVYPEIINIVEESYKETKLGPVALERWIEKNRNIHIPRNTIYRIMDKKGLIKPNPKKRRQRKFVKFERKHSNSLWQGDIKELVLKNNERKYLIAFLDDASRLITCYGLYNEPTTENVIKTLLKGFSLYGIPREILTDNGTQFIASRKDKNGNFKHRFKEFLDKYRIKHIRARVHHPQTIGKIERWFGTVEKKLPLFDYDLDKLVYVYNNQWPHLSLWFEIGETPKEAFLRKLPPENILGMFLSLVEKR